MNRGLNTTTFFLPTLQFSILKHLIREVLPGFNVGEISACQFHSGGFNHTYRIATVAGQTYYLRAYRQPWRTLADIQFELDVRAAPLFACARYLWHIGVHTENSPDWGVDFLNTKYFDTHLKRLRDAEADYLV